MYQCITKELENIARMQKKKKRRKDNRENTPGSSASVI